jgi:Holliday junction resolvasome RuvABC ATP-dependent DNA helicase subunit
MRQTTNNTMKKACAHGAYQNLSAKKKSSNKYLSVSMPLAGGANRLTTPCSMVPPGLGKTSLAMILANEMGVQIKITSCSAIERQGDLAAILTNLQPGDILFIDEIHRLNRAIEEVLYPAMEDFALDIVVGKRPRCP